MPASSPGTCRANRDSCPVCYRIWRIFFPGIPGNLGTPQGRPGVLGNAGSDSPA